MHRITIYTADECGERVRLGWFDRDAATLAAIEDERWDGNNMLGVISGLQLTRAELYRTRAGRWAEHQDATREFNGPDTWRFLTDDEARDWLMRSDDAEENLEKWFPDTPDESGPGPKGGRPAVGQQISVAYPRELLDRIDAAAEAVGQSRAEWLRWAAEEALHSA